MAKIQPAASSFHRPEQRQRRPAKQGGVGGDLVRQLQLLQERENDARVDGFHVGDFIAGVS
jgi:hypothetical protein